MVGCLPVFDGILDFLEQLRGSLVEWLGTSTKTTVIRVGVFGSDTLVGV